MGRGDTEEKEGRRVLQAAKAIRGFGALNLTVLALDWVVGRNRVKKVLKGVMEVLGKKKRKQPFVLEWLRI